MGLGRAPVERRACCDPARDDGSEESWREGIAACAARAAADWVAEVRSRLDGTAPACGEGRERVGGRQRTASVSLTVSQRITGSDPQILRLNATPSASGEGVPIE